MHMRVEPTQSVVLISHSGLFFWQTKLALASFYYFSQTFKFPRGFISRFPAESESEADRGMWVRPFSMKDNAYPESILMGDTWDD